jgi:hypothetical protein
MTAHEDAARNARRAASLKDNLKRRKEQARVRAFEAPRTRGAPLDEGGGGGPQAVLEGEADKGPNAAKKPR